jgi:hypothetical protein
MQLKQYNKYTTRWKLNSVKVEGENEEYNKQKKSCKSYLISQDGNRNTKSHLVIEI